MRIRIGRLAAGFALGAALAVCAATARPAFAASLEGVSFPDTATVGDTSVKLNGIGLRKAYVFVKVYVAALYLQTPTHDARAAIDTDEAKRVAMSFLRDVTHDEMKTAWSEGFANTATPALKPQIDQFTGYFTVPIQTGQQYEFDYAPGKGTTVTIAGQVKGTIPGAEFMRALWGIWLGSKPPSEALKDGMLGTS
jgi:hypothetical protein